MIFDLALLRAANRTQQPPENERDVAIFMNDADTTYSNTQYLETMMSELDKPENQTKDAILGRQDLDPSIFKKLPTFQAALRFWQYAGALVRAKRGYVETQGRNTVIRGSSYAAIGGNRTKDFWADVEFIQLLNRARGNNAHPVAYSNASWLTVDPRREASKFLNGEAIAWTWGNDFDTRSVRGEKLDYEKYQDVDASVIGDAPESDGEVKKFNERLAWEVNQIAKLFYQPLQDEETRRRYTQNILNTNENLSNTDIIQRTLGLLGIDADVRPSANPEEPIITFKNTAILRSSLKDYKEKEYWKSKIQSHPLFKEIPSI
jgi:hypothetical protein